MAGKNVLVIATYVYIQIFKPGFLKSLLCGCMRACVCVSAPEAMNN